MTVLTARHVATGKGALNAGAGTGHLDERLMLAGYGDLEALDMSEGTLALAEHHKVYSGFHCADLAAPIDILDGRFGAVVSTAAFGISHAPVCEFRKLAHLTRPGGHPILTVRMEGIDGRAFPEGTRHFESGGLWRLIETLGPSLPSRTKRKA